MDISMNISTYFACFAKQQPIDSIANRFLYFGDRVLGHPPDQNNGFFSIKSKSHQKISQLLFLNTAQKIFSYFSNDYKAYIKPFLKN